MSRLARAAWVVLFAMIVFSVGLILFRSVVSIPLQIPKDYNEGYYAFSALRALGPGNLYPDRDSLISYGYTPLFSYVTGVLGSILNDHIIAGRWIALVSFLFTAIGIGAVVRSLTGSWLITLLMILIFLGYIGLEHPGYVGMSDPQWLTQAFAVAALYVYIKVEDRSWASIPVIILLLLAGLTKQTSIALPVALAVHLIWHRRDAVPRWLAHSAFALVSSLVLLYIAHGPDFPRALLFTDPLSEYSFQKILNNILGFSRSFFPLCIGLALFLWLAPRTRVNHLLGCYVASSAIIGFALTGGQFIGLNHLYDLLIAITITTGLAISALSERLSGRVNPVAMTFVAGVLISSSFILTIPEKLSEVRTAISGLGERQARVAKTVSHIASVNGSVFCETMALCYWAGKHHELDILVLRNRLTSGSMSRDKFSTLLDSGYFRLLQFHSDGISGRTKRLPDWANDLILKKYEVEANTMGGSFLTPQRRSPA